MEISTILGAVLKASAPALAARAKKSERVVSALASLHIDIGRLPTDFDELYTVALVTYGLDKPAQVLEFFRDEYLRVAFKRAFETGDAAVLEREANELFARLVENGSLKEFDYDPRRELESFTAVYWSLLEKGRSPQEANVDRQLQAILAESESAREDIARINASIAGVAHLIEQSGVRQSQLRGPVSKTRLRVLLVQGEKSPIRKSELENELIFRGFDAQIDTLSGGGLIEHSPDIFVALLDESAAGAPLGAIEQALAVSAPVFVYSLPFKERNQSLEAFIARNVSNAPGAAFHRAISSVSEFESSAATDISDWLKREYRMLTAKSKSTLSPGRQYSRTFQAASHIQGFANFSLEQGTSLDLLYEDVVAWFRALDFRLEDHHLSSERHADMIVNIPNRRRFDRILVRVVSGELIGADVDSLAVDVASSGCDEGWAVAASRVSPAAVAAAAERELVECYTLDELIDQDADFDKYLRWLDEEVALRKIVDQYIPLDCQKREPGAEIKFSVYDDSNGGTEGYLDRWIADPSREHISVLGEFGTGKTWLTLHYAWTMAQRYKEAKRAGTSRPRLPIIIPLRDYAKAVSVESLFSEFLFRKHDMGMRSYRAFEELNRMGKLLLIFDGFDEMAARIDRQAMIDNFWQLASVVVPGSKAILTCRSEHFPNEGEGRDLLAARLQSSVMVQGTPPQFDVLELRTLTDQKIRRLVEQRSNSDTADLVVSHPDLRELARRPIMSELILDALPEIEAGRDLDLTRIYKYAIRRKMIRDIRDERTFTSLSDKLFFLCELSWEMFVSSRMSVNYKDFPETIVRCFGARVARSSDLDHWRYDMLGQTILIRDANGDYAPAHRSFIEFFAAYRVVAHLGILHQDYLDLLDVNGPAESSPKTWNEFFFDDVVVPRQLSHFVREDDVARLVTSIGGAPWSHATVQMIREMIDPEVTIADLVIDLLRDLRELDIDLGYLPDNLARIALQGDGDVFRGVNLDGTTFRDAVLDYRDVLETVDFSGTSLKHADLSGCDLENVNFANSNCSRADFTDARYFPRDPFYLIYLAWADASHLVGVNRRGGIVLFAYQDGELERLELEGVDTFVRTSGMNVAGRYLGAIQSRSAADQFLGLAWDLTNGKLVGRSPLSHEQVAYSILSSGQTMVVALPPQLDAEGPVATLLEAYDLVGGLKLWSIWFDADVRDLAPGPTDSQLILFTGSGLFICVEVDEIGVDVVSSVDVGADVARSLGVAVAGRPTGRAFFDRQIGDGYWIAMSEDRGLVVVESEYPHRSRILPDAYFDTVSVGRSGSTIASTSVGRDEISVYRDWEGVPTFAWNVDSFPSATLGISALAVSPDGENIAVATGDCAVRLFTIRGEELAVANLSEFYRGADFSDSLGISETTAAELRRRGATI